MPPSERDWSMNLAVLLAAPCASFDNASEFQPQQGKCVVLPFVCVPPTASQYCHPLGLLALH